MAKSIRSKAKRKNRTEFRNTIGTDAAKATQAIVQAKLQECVNSGGMNSFDRLANLFSGNNTTTNNDDGDAVMGNNSSSTTDGNGKDSSKIPAKKSKTNNKHYIPAQYGDKTTKKLGERKMRRERTTNGNGTAKVAKTRGRGRMEGRRTRGQSLRSSSKKSRGKKLATI